MPPRQPKPRLKPAGPPPQRAGRPLKRGARPSQPAANPPQRASDRPRRDHPDAQPTDLTPPAPSYFQKTPVSVAGRSSNAATLNAMFDSFRDDPTQPDKIGAEGTMRYLQSLGIALDEPVVLALLTQLQAPGLTELARAAFVAGWEQRGAATAAQQRAEADRFRAQLRAEPDFFRAVYRHAFALGIGADGGAGPGARSLPFDTAAAFWRLLFDPARGWAWADQAGVGSGTPWLEAWLGFLEAKGQRGVSRDLWEQTLAFARQSAADPGLAWWSEDAAWPSAVDEFVEFVKKERATGRLPTPGGAPAGGDGMEGVE